MSMAMDNHPRKKASRIPLLFLAFFGVVLAANLTMVYFAMESWTGLETKNHYLKGLAYNDALDGAEAQAKLGWMVKMTVAREDGQAVSLDISVSNKNGKALAGADMTVLFIRPTHTGYDVKTEAIETRPGVYRATASLPLAGVWDVKRIIRHGDGNHQTVERITVGANRP